MNYKLSRYYPRSYSWCENRSGACHWRPQSIIEHNGGIFIRTNSPMSRDQDSTCRYWSLALMREVLV